MLDETISCEEYICTVKTNLGKHIGRLCRAKPLIEEKSLNWIYFAYTHSYLNYANTAWTSTYNFHFHQKNTVRIVFNEDKVTYYRPLLRLLNSLNILQINLYQHLVLTYKLNRHKQPLTFNEVIKKPFRKYPTKFSESCFSLIPISLKSTKYSIPFHSLKIWNKFLTKEEEQLQSFSMFKNVVHTKLVEGECKLENFWIKLRHTLALNAANNFGA